jgi:uncharacterized protein (TIGR03083 family)
MESPLSPDTYLDAIRANATELVDAAERTTLDAPVPTCPDWTVADLLGHIGRVHRMAAGNAVRAPEDGFWPGKEIEIPEPAARAAWVREGADQLVAVLDRPSEQPASTFFPPGNVGFWQRRQAHETAMHRVDAQAAAGDVAPIDAQLAADGIDELFVLLGHAPWRTPPTGNGETIHLHCTDIDGEWVARLGADGLEVERVHAKGDVAVRGGASDLLCWLSGRGPVDHVEVIGDAEQLPRWRAITTF